MTYLSTIIAVLLFIPFVGWGIYILRLQLQFREEMEPVAKWATVVGVALFFIIELNLLRVGLSGNRLYYLMTAMALMVSTTALYGHLFVSIASQLAVDMIHPPQEQESETPQFSSAEALEEIGDYTGALNEYFVLARIFPKDPEPVLKIADAYIHLNDIENAVVYFEKGLAGIGFPDRAIRITNRLVGIYDKQLERPDDARRILKEFVARFPSSEHVNSVKAKLDRMDAKKEEPKPFKSATGLLEPPSTDLLG